MDINATDVAFQSAHPFTSVDEATERLHGAGFASTGEALNYYISVSHPQ